MPWLISLVTGIGVPKRFAKAVLIGVGALLACLLVLGAVKLHDRRVVASHDASIALAASKADRKADTNAATSRVADQARSNSEATQIKEAVNEAGPNPAARRAAYYKCVQSQQSARRSGKLTTSC